MVALAALWLLAASRVHVNASWSDGAWGYAAFPLFGEDPEIGDRVLFEPPEALGSPVPYLKTVRGVPGMRVAVGTDGTVSLNGVRLGRAKTHALDGRPLAAIASETIPDGHYFLYADHVDSHDSRYAEIGLVPRARITGRAVALPRPALAGPGGAVGRTGGRPFPNGAGAAAPREGAMNSPVPFRAFPIVALALGIGLAAGAPASGADLGVRGATWPVAEPDLLEQIEARLSAMQSSGEMARIERDARTTARSRLEEPVPVAGIAPAPGSAQPIVRSGDYRRTGHPAAGWDAHRRRRDTGQPAGPPCALSRSAVRRRPPRGGDRLGARPWASGEDRAAGRAAARPRAEPWPGLLLRPGRPSRGPVRGCALRRLWSSRPASGCALRKSRSRTGTPDHCPGQARNPNGRTEPC